MQGQMRIEALFGTKGQVAGLAPMLAFHTSLVGVKVALEVAHVSEQLSANLTWNALLHLGVTFQHVQFQMMLCAHSITAF